MSLREPIKKSANARIHLKIKGDVEYIRQLAVDRPGYRPDGPSAAPHLLALVRTAVDYANSNYANSLSAVGKENNFMYHGRRHPLVFTILGRVIVCDQKGRKIGAPAYGAVE